MEYLTEVWGCLDESGQFSVWVVGIIIAMWFVGLAPWRLAIWSDETRDTNWDMPDSFIGGPLLCGFLCSIAGGMAALVGFLGWSFLCGLYDLISCLWCQGC